MSFGSKFAYQILWNGPGEPSAAAGSPPAQPPSNPSDQNPDAITEGDSWVLDHFDAMQADEAGEDIEEPLSPTPVEVPKPVSASAERPEGVSSPPSPPTGNAPEPVAALATPAPAVPTVNSPAPVVGASTNQPVSPVPAAQTSVLDPTKIYSEIVQGIANSRTALIEQLTAQYLMSEQEASELGITPEHAKMMARMAATAHLNATQSVAQMQAEQLSPWLNGQLAARTASQKKEDEFFGEWSQLRAVPKDQLGKVFEAVNTLHPGLRDAAWRKKAGEMACASFGLPSIPTPVASNGQPTAAPQQIRTPGPIVRQVNGLMHNPVGTSTATAPVARELSEVERFYELLKATDSGELEM